MAQLPWYIYNNAKLLCMQIYWNITWQGHMLPLLPQQCTGLTAPPPTGPGTLSVPTPAHEAPRHFTGRKPTGSSRARICPPHSPWPSPHTTRLCRDELSYNPWPTVGAWRPPPYAHSFNPTPVLETCCHCHTVQLPPRQSHFECISKFLAPHQI